MTEGSAVKKTRAFELDFLRGLALFLMILMHFAYDIRYIFGYDAFEFMEYRWFWVFIEPFFLCLFVGISGVCCTFSKNNFKRAGKLLVVALCVTAVTYVATYHFGIECLIIFNVLHMLAVSIFVYALLSLIEKKAKIDPKVMNVLLTFFGLYFAQVGKELVKYDGKVDTNIFIPIGITGKTHPFMGDYMPLFPWIGVFLVGAVIGRIIYSDRKTLFKNAPGPLLKITRPFEFIGRHSLIIYVVHQPIVLALTYGVDHLLRKIC